MWTRAFSWFSREGMSEAGPEEASLNTFSSLWSRRTVPGCLISGPRVSRAGA